MNLDEIGKLIKPSTMTQSPLGSESKRLFSENADSTVSSSRLPALTNSLTKKTRVTRPRKRPTADDVPPNEIVHICPDRSFGLTLCMESEFTSAGDDPERVALVPIYHWCRS